MSFDSEYPTDKTRGIGTLKLRLDVREEFKNLVTTHNKSLRSDQKKWNNYSEALQELMKVYDNITNHFVTEYTKAINRCKTCPELNKDKCKTVCNIRKIYDILEKCQNLAKTIFK